MSWAAPLGVLLTYRCRKTPGLRAKGGPGPGWGASTDRSLPLGPPSMASRSCRKKNLGMTGRGWGWVMVLGSLPQIPPACLPAPHLSRALRAMTKPWQSWSLRPENSSQPAQLLLPVPSATSS